MKKCPTYQHFHITHSSIYNYVYKWFQLFWGLSFALKQSFSFSHFSASNGEKKNMIYSAIHQKKFLVCTLLKKGHLLLCTVNHFNNVLFGWLLTDMLFTQTHEQNMNWKCLSKAGEHLGRLMSDSVSSAPLTAPRLLLLLHLSCWTFSWSSRWV